MDESELKEACLDFVEKKCGEKIPRDHREVNIEVGYDEYDGGCLLEVTGIKQSKYSDPPW